jgi:UrcA family protein
MFKPRLLTASKAFAVASLMISMSTVSHADGISPDPRSTTVSLAGLNSNSPADAQVIYTRLLMAAKSVCGLEFEGHPILGAKFDECQKSTLKQAVSAYNKPLVTEIYNKRNQDVLDVGTNPALAAIAAK